MSEPSGLREALVQPDSLRVTDDLLKALDLVRRIRAKGKLQSERVCYNGQIQRKYTWTLTEGEAARDILLAKQGGPHDAAQRWADFVSGVSAGWVNIPSYWTSGKVSDWAEAEARRRFGEGK